MKFVPFSINDGQTNMATDSQLLDEAICKKYTEPIFRLYGWAPACVSLGRNQNDDFLDLELLKSLNIDVVRRLTGGRALLHDNEITYSFICPQNYLKNGNSVILSYIEICEFLINKFKKLGIELDFGKSKPIKTGFDYCMSVSTGADLCFKNKKLIGSAQCRKSGYILQHGSILYDYDKNLLKEIFKEEINTKEIITIKQINSSITKEDLIKVLSN